MVRVTTQETYDEVVKENIEEFEMTPAEAVNEAIAQFEAQGVDLSNIIKDLALGSGDSHLVCDAVEKLKEISLTNDDEQILKELQVLKSECEKDIARRVRAGKEGAYSLLIDLLVARHKMYLQAGSEKDAVFIVAVLDTLVALMDVQPDLLEVKGIELIKNILDNVTDEGILTATLRWTSICCMRHEMNRQNIFAADIVDTLKRLLKGHKNRKLLSETLNVIRKLTLDDDIRVAFGKAHDHAREMGIQMLEPLAGLLKDNTKPPLVAELMLTIASLLVRNELCAAIANSVDDLMAVLTDNYDSVTVVQQAYKLITALAGNDDVKRKLVNSGMAPVIVALLSRHAHDEKASHLSLKCIAALTLREPLHSRQFLDNGAPEAIVDCLKQHPESAAVQKNGCWAIRNMVARCRDQNDKFTSIGAEAILNAAYTKFNEDFGFDVKSALRDLECDVQLDEQWTGRGGEIRRDN